MNLDPMDPLGAADRTLLFVNATQKVALEHAYQASFMPKPFDGFNRNASHIHLSMIDLKGKNLFYELGAEYNLSKVGRYFIGGILRYARSLSENS
jgi:glutamine synthetase